MAPVLALSPMLLSVQLSPIISSLQLSPMSPLLLLSPISPVLSLFHRCLHFFQYYHQCSCLHSTLTVAAFLTNVTTAVTVFNVTGVGAFIAVAYAAAVSNVAVVTKVTLLL